MSYCKQPIPGTDKTCGMEIKWKYPYMQVPSGEKNYPLNADETPHRTTCKSMNPSKPTPERPREVLKVKPKETPETPQWKEAPGRGDRRPPDEQEFKAEYKTADNELMFNQGFRYLEVVVSKGKRINTDTHPDIPMYQHRDFFISRKIVVDNPTMDVEALVRRAYADNNSRIEEEIRNELALIRKQREEYAEGFGQQ